MQMRADGNLVLVAANTDKQDRAYALYRMHINGMPEEYMIYLVRLFSKKTAGGVVLAGKIGGNSAPQILSEVYDKLSVATKRCEEWVDAMVEVPEVVLPEKN